MVGKLLDRIHIFHTDSVQSLYKLVPANHCLEAAKWAKRNRKWLLL